MAEIRNPTADTQMGTDSADAVISVIHLISESVVELLFISRKVWENYRLTIYINRFLMITKFAK